MGIIYNILTPGLLIAVINFHNVKINSIIYSNDLTVFSWSVYFMANMNFNRRNNEMVKKIDKKIL